jgi:RNA polymerase sigma factor (sigma-70 family)
MPAILKRSPGLLYEWNEGNGCGLREKGCMLEERLLVWQFNRGRPEALREIYERHKVELVTLATALLADKAEAEDVVHDVFAGFLKSAGTFRLTGSLKAFLATCVANRARNWNKVSRRRVVEDGESSEPVAPNQERPDWAAVFEEELQRVARAMAELPYEQREAVLLHLRGGGIALGRMSREIGQLHRVGEGQQDLRLRSRPQHRSG